MDTQKNNIRTAIIGSLLLSPKRKNGLLELLPTLDENGLSALAELLLSEPARIEQACALVLRKAVGKKNTKWLKALESYLNRGMRQLRKTHEETTDRIDDERIELLFDTAS